MAVTGITATSRCFQPLAVEYAELTTLILDHWRMHLEQNLVGGRQLHARHAFAPDHAYLDTGLSRHVRDQRQMAIGGKVDLLRLVAWLARPYTQNQLN